MRKVYERINWENEPSVRTPLNAVNLNNIDSAIDELDDRVLLLDETKAELVDFLASLKSVEFNDDTGVFKFNYNNNTSQIIDLNIEKIPVSFSMSDAGIITMVNTDGTTYTADVKSLIKSNIFKNSSNISISDTVDQNGNHNITASLIAGSITDEYLRPNYLADISVESERATSAANSANSSAESANNLYLQVKAELESGELKGEKGDKGDQGEQGVQGPQGPQGIQGEKGEKGNKGDQGEQGIQGIQGPQGIQGEKGEKGDKGESGVYTAIKNYFVLEVDENGDLYAITTDTESPPEFELDENGDLYIILNEGE